MEIRPVPREKEDRPVCLEAQHMRRRARDPRITAITPLTPASFHDCRVLCELNKLVRKALKAPISASALSVKLPHEVEIKT
jgi:hypothetical protein